MEPSRETRYRSTNTVVVTLVVLVALVLIYYFGAQIQDVSDDHAPGAGMGASFEG